MKAGNGTSGLVVGRVSKTSVIPPSRCLRSKRNDDSNK